MSNKSHISTDDDDTNALDLDALWQQQPTLKADPDQIKSRAQQQTFKQRLYMALDCLSLTPLIVLFVLDLDMNTLLRTFLIVNAILATVNVAYFIKLRWVSAFASHKNTLEYKERLLKQLSNNAKIAMINKHACWVLTVITVCFLSIYGWLAEWTVDVALRKFAQGLGFTLVFLIPFYIWAKKRQQRFENELRLLQEL